MRDRKRGEVSNSLVGSFHVIMVQEAESHYHEIAKNAEQQFRMYHGADQLILDHKNTWGPEGTKIEEEIPGASRQDFWPAEPIPDERVVEGGRISASLGK